MQVKSVKTGSVFWAACASLSYFYMVSTFCYQFFELFNKDVMYMCLPLLLHSFDGM